MAVDLWHRLCMVQRLYDYEKKLEIRSLGLNQTPLPSIQSYHTCIFIGMLRHTNIIFMIMKRYWKESSLKHFFACTCVVNRGYVHCTTGNHLCSHDLYALWLFTVVGEVLYIG